MRSFSAVLETGNALDSRHYNLVVQRALLVARALVFLRSSGCSLVCTLLCIHRCGLCFLLSWPRIALLTGSCCPCKPPHGVPPSTGMRELRLPMTPERTGQCARMTATTGIFRVFRSMTLPALKRSQTPCLCSAPTSTPAKRKAVRPSFQGEAPTSHDEPAPARKAACVPPFLPTLAPALRLSSLSALPLPRQLRNPRIHTILRQNDLLSKEKLPSQSLAQLKLPTAFLCLYHMLIRRMRPTIRYRERGMDGNFVVLDMSSRSRKLGRHRLILRAGSKATPALTEMKTRGTWSKNLPQAHAVWAGCREFLFWSPRRWRR
jgi:hypothetical protein